MLDQTDESEVDVSASCKESKITVLFRQKADIPLKIYSFDIPCTEDVSDVRLQYSRLTG